MMDCTLQNNGVVAAT